MQFLARTLRSPALAEQALEDKGPKGTVEAVGYLTQVVRRGTDASTDYLALAELLARNGDLPGAITTLRKSILRDPYNPLIYLNYVADSVFAGP
jgi:hypothetical protein